MMSTVRPFMALSMASCTRCSLSASSALVAWGGGGGGGGGDIVSLVRHYSLGHREVCVCVCSAVLLLKEKCVCVYMCVFVLQ